MDATQIAAYTTPAVVVIGGLRWLLGFLASQGHKALQSIDDRAIARDQKLDEKLDRIEVQTTQTNGSVKTVVRRLDRLEGVVYGKEAGNLPEL